MKKIVHVSLICVCFAIWQSNQPVLSADTKPKLYDESADGKKQIADALLIAKKDNRHLLLQYGANWCGWCHRLHKLLETDPEIHSKLTADYVLVLIDVNQGHNQDLLRKYGEIASFGLPSIVILDADGKVVTTKNTAELEEGDHHDPKKVLSFLNKYSPNK